MENAVFNINKIKVIVLDHDPDYGLATVIPITADIKHIPSGGFSLRSKTLPGGVWYTNINYITSIPDRMLTDYYLNVEDEVVDLINSEIYKSISGEEGWTDPPEYVKHAGPDSNTWIEEIIKINK